LPEDEESNPPPDEEDEESKPPPDEEEEESKPPEDELVGGVLAGGCGFSPIGLTPGAVGAPGTAGAEGAPGVALPPECDCAEATRIVTATRAASAKAVAIAAVANFLVRIGHS
jgi:hypothetical protein